MEYRKVQEYVKQKQRKTIRKRFFLSISIAASVSILLFFATKFVQPNFFGLFESTSYYYDKYFEHFECYAYQVCRGKSRKDSILTAIQHYNNREYAVASKYFDGLLETKRETNLMVFGGINYLANHEYEKAHDLFIELLNVETIYSEEIRWYLSLVYLINGEETKADEFLHFLSIHSGRYQQRAQEILDGLSLAKSAPHSPLSSP